MNHLNHNTYCIIMAGGFGSRFWPICKANNPKQFIDIMGNGQSMLQTTFQRFENICPRENIIIVTGELYADRVRQQIKGLAPYQVLSEPTRRNTAPCIAYAASVIYHLNPKANIIVTPSDHAIFGQEKFEQDINQALAITENNDYIVTIGVRPTNPNTKYGYIQFAEDLVSPKSSNLHKIITFTEKPPYEMARQFIATGEFFWNAGIFIWKLSTLRRAYRTHLPNIAKPFFTLKSDTPAIELDRIYSVCEAISVDFGIMEHADNVYVLEASFGWSDVESWDSLYTTCHHDSDGNALISGNVFAYDVHNSIVHLPSNRTVILQGLDNCIIAGDENTLLVCRRDQEERLVKFASDVELAELTKVKK
ncbi:MAG: mannose-1-phosphate guanylyltransferase [Bacteroidales bacterium]|nr:mannose-1-phosphate guanylyltransferase [Bacteroidales bacterium]